MHESGTDNMNLVKDMIGDAALVNKIKKKHIAWPFAVKWTSALRTEMSWGMGVLSAMLVTAKSNVWQEQA